MQGLAQGIQHVGLVLLQQQEILNLSEYVYSYDYH